MSESGGTAAVVWLTGLSGAGKSTISGLLANELRARGRAVCVLDGDALRRGLCADLGFSAGDRAENVRRVAEVARLLSDAGIVAIVSLISPFVEGREAARTRIGSGRFVEVHVDVSLAVAERRDPKGLYRRARSGELPDFTGIDSPYEAPERPDVRLETEASTPLQSVALLIASLEAAGHVSPAADPHR